jgi:hypothetical protein
VRATAGARRRHDPSPGGGQHQAARPEKQGPGNFGAAAGGGGATLARCPSSVPPPSRTGATQSALAVRPCRRGARGGPYQIGGARRTATSTRRPRAWTRSAPRRAVSAATLATPLTMGPPHSQTSANPRKRAARQSQPKREGPRSLHRTVGQPPENGPRHSAPPTTNVVACHAAASEEPRASPAAGKTAAGGPLSEDPRQRAVTIPLRGDRGEAFRHRRLPSLSRLRSPGQILDGRSAPSAAAAARETASAFG